MIFGPRSTFDKPILILRKVESEGVLSVPAQGALLKSYQQGVGDAEREEEELRKTLVCVL